MHKNSKTQMKKRVSNHNHNPLLSDKVFMDFCRCLYQAKAIVRDLSSFSDAVCPALHSIHNASQVIQYLEATFSKFARLCQILMMVLCKMEASSAKYYCIDSFRFEVLEEWRTATSIKQRLTSFMILEKGVLHDNNNNSNSNSNSNSNIMIEQASSSSLPLPVQRTSNTTATARTTTTGTTSDSIDVGV